MTDDAPAFARGAFKILWDARALQAERGDKLLGINHLLRVYLTNYLPMAEGLADTKLGGLAARVDAELEDGTAGGEVALVELRAEVLALAEGRGASPARERDVGTALLRRAGVLAAPEGEGAAVGDATSAVDDVVGETLLAADADALELPWPPGENEEETGGAEGAARERRPTPALDELGRDLTAAAREGRLATLIGRGPELQTAIETLCRKKKRNPVLIGRAGVGKTAIVEGLAQLIAADSDEVPKPLRGARIIEIDMTSFTAGASAATAYERLTSVIAEASHPDTILFIDEFHTIVSSTTGGRDYAQVLKPPLARGEIAIIGATTDNEYQRIADQDAALDRRFQPIVVSEMSRDDALEVGRSVRDRIREERDIEVGDDVLRWLTDFAARHLHNRTFPDKLLDPLEQAVAHAVVSGKKTVDLDDAKAVARRLVGLSLDVTERVERLARRLEELELLSIADREQLIHRLRLTMTGHDFEAVQPNAVLLLAGPMVRQADVLATVVAEALYGSLRRVHEIDLNGFATTDDACITRFFGMPYGYVGAELNRGFVQQLNGQPFAVLLLRNVDACDVGFTRMIADGLRLGYFTDAHASKQYLSDAVVIMTADAGDDGGGPLGFAPSSGDGAQRAAVDALKRKLGEIVGPTCQVVTSGGAPERVAAGWVRELLLPRLAERYRAEGLDLTWDDAVVDWLVARACEGSGPGEWQAVLEDGVGLQIAALIDDTAAGRRRAVRIACRGDALTVTVRGGRRPKGAAQ